MSRFTQLDWMSDRALENSVQNLDNLESFILLDDILDKKTRNDVMQRIPLINSEALLLINSEISEILNIKEP